MSDMKLSGTISSAASMTAALSKPDVVRGIDGGYYTPYIERPTDDTLEVGFIASKETMPEVAPTTVNIGLPGRINDTMASADASWSGKAVVERLCEKFEVEGNPAVCWPVEASPLGAKVGVEAKQHFDWAKAEGSTTQSGTPSPDAPIPLVDSIPAGGYCVKSTAPEGGYWRVDLDEALGGIGEYKDALEIDQYTGQWRAVRNSLAMTYGNAEEWTVYNQYYLHISEDYHDAVANSTGYVVKGNALCSHVVYDGALGGYATIHATASRLYISKTWAEMHESLDAWKSWLSAQSAAGHPMCIRFALAQAIVTTGQATHVATASGLTELTVQSMGLTAGDPDHPCAISVPKSAKVTRSGKNLWPLGDQKFTRALYLTLGNYYPQGVYTLSADVASDDTDGTICLVQFLDKKNGQVLKAMNIERGTRQRITVEIPNQFSAMNLYASYNYANGANDNCTFTNIQLELGTTATSYEPYQGNDEYAAELPDGFGGGTVDMTSGTVTETWSTISLPISAMNNNVENFPGWRNAGIRDIVGAGRNTAMVYVTEHYCNVGSYPRVNTNGANDILFFLKSMFGDMEQNAIKAAYPDLVVELCIKRLTPIERTTDMATIPAIAGENTLLTDADALTVSGYEDPRHTRASLEERISALESAITNK